MATSPPSHPPNPRQRPPRETPAPLSPTPIPTPRGTPPPQSLPAEPTNGCLFIKYDRIEDLPGKKDRATGTIVLNGRTYTFVCGGHYRGYVPEGVYAIEHYARRMDNKGFVKDGVGWGFKIEDKYDPRVGDTRTELFIHPDGRAYGTAGCIGIQGDGATQEPFYQDLKAEIEKTAASSRSLSKKHKPIHAIIISSPIKPMKTPFLKNVLAIVVSGGIGAAFWGSLENAYPQNMPALPGLSEIQQAELAMTYGSPGTRAVIRLYIEAYNNPTEDTYRAFAYEYMNTIDSEWGYRLFEALERRSPGLFRQAARALTPQEREEYLSFLEFYDL